MFETGFTSFDGLAGGLEPAKTYLIYGSNRSGKTTFALGFTAEGLTRGERCVYVSGRPAENIIAQAAAFGYDFESAVRNQNLAILEYPDNIREHSTRLLDDSRIFGEFKATIGAEHFNRLVFDPVTPLVGGLSTAAASTRLRSMMRLFGAGGATSLYIAGGTSQDGNLAVSKEVVHGILRFEGEGEGSHTLFLERLPGIAPGSASALHFEVVPGIGLRESGQADRLAEEYPLSPRAASKSYSFGPSLSYAGALNGGAQRQTAPILLIHPDAGQRVELRAVMEKLRPVVEASGAADGMALVAATGPAVIVMARHGRGVSGVEIARKIRHSGRNVPILMLASQAKRRTDMIQPLQAGADICLEYPADPRVLTLQIQGLLGRPAAVRSLPSSVPDYTPPPRDVGSTAELEYFMERLDAEARYAREFGGKVVVLTLREPFNCGYLEELSNVVSVLVRSSDLVHTGKRGVAVLLSDADASAPFLSRFRERWAAALPIVEEFHPAVGADYLSAAQEFLVSTISGTKGAISGTNGTAHVAPRSLSVGASASGAVARTGEF